MAMEMTLDEEKFFERRRVLELKIRFNNENTRAIFLVVREPLLRLKRVPNL